MHTCAHSPGVERIDESWACGLWRPNITFAKHVAPSAIETRSPHSPATMDLVQRSMLSSSFWGRQRCAGPLQRSSGSGLPATQKSVLAALLYPGPNSCRHGYNVAGSTSARAEASNSSAAQRGRARDRSGAGEPSTSGGQERDSTSRGGSSRQGIPGPPNTPRPRAAQAAGGSDTSSERRRTAPAQNGPAVDIQAQRARQPRSSGVLSADTPRRQRQSSPGPGSAPPVASAAATRPLAAAAGVGAGAPGRGGPQGRGGRSGRGSPLAGRTPRGRGAAGTGLLLTVRGAPLAVQDLPAAARLLAHSEARLGAPLEGWNPAELCAAFNLCAKVRCPRKARSRPSCPPALI
jgi:hypothetical protein